jgi:hypothetical protein
MAIANGGLGSILRAHEIAAAGQSRVRLICRHRGHLVVHADLE